MQSTPHDSEPIDLALYEATKDLVLRDVMTATSHSDLDGVAMAMSKVSHLLDVTPWTMWDELGVIVLTLQPLDARQSLDIYGGGIAQWVSSHAEADAIHWANCGRSWTTVIVNPGEAMQTVIAGRRSPSVTESGWDRILGDVLALPAPVERTRRNRVLLAVAAVVGALVAILVGARTVSAATPSCSLHVIEVEDDAIVWGYTPHDRVQRGVHLPGGAWVALQIGGRTRTPVVTEIGYPSVGDRILVADLIHQCSAAPVTTTTNSTPAPTTTTPEPTTTSTTAAPTTTTTSTTAAPTTTTTAKARPAVGCPAGTVLAFIHHGDPDENGVWTFRVVINGVTQIAGSGSRTWIATWPVPEGGVTVETDDDIEVTCSTVPPASITTTSTTTTSTTPTVPEPPTTSVTAVTPAPLPPATWVVVPPTTTTTADVLPPVTVTPPAVTGGELPRTGVEMRHLPLLVLALITAGALITLAVDRKES